MTGDGKSRMIRNSTIDFLIFSSQTDEDGIEVRHEEGTVWLTQKLMATLFDVNVATINEHLKSIYRDGELPRETTTRKIQTVQIKGDRNVSRKVDFYNLDAIISVGYRIDSVRAAQFRQWSTDVLRRFALQGYVIDRKRMENGSFLGEDYFENLLEEIREIRLSNRHFYQKITDIYATSLDYDKNAITTRNFFDGIQNKLHFAVHGHTAPELIMKRANSGKSRMGLTSWRNAPDGKILKSDVSEAKNYLTDEELKSLGRIVNSYLDLAEERARRKIPMTMEDWSQRLGLFLQFEQREILQGPGKVSKLKATYHATSEFEKYRIEQDRVFESDFDRMVKGFGR